MSSDSLSSRERAGSTPLLTRVRRRVRRLVRDATRIPVGAVRWGDFRNLQPICPEFGFSRGKPVDRHYIEHFLAEQANDIRGRVLEIKDPGYTRRFGGSRVERSDVLDINAENPAATIIGDLSDPDTLEAGTYDCVIFTQTLQFLYEPRQVLHHLHRSLKPGGALLMTVPGITPVRSRDAWYWNFTDRSVQAMLGEMFQQADVSVSAHGNLIAATAFLQGLSAGELRDAELASRDPAYQVVIGARAIKAQH